MATSFADLRKRLRKSLEEAQQGFGLGSSSSAGQPSKLKPINILAPVEKTIAVAPTVIRSAVNAFAEYPRAMGRGVGQAIVAPIEQRRLNKEAETDFLLQKTLNSQSKRALNSGDANKARQLSNRSAQIANRTATNFEKFGANVGDARRDTTAGTVGTMIQLLGGKGLTGKAAAGYAGVTGTIGGAINKATGGSFSEGFGEGVGSSLSYRGVNKLTQPGVDRLLKNARGIPLLRRVAVSGGANAVANMAEDDLLTRIKERRAPTSSERLMSGAIGFGVGSVGPVGQAVSQKIQLITGKRAKSRLGRKPAQTQPQTQQASSLDDLMKQPRNNGKYSGWTKEQMMKIRTHPDFNKADLSPKHRKLFNEFDFENQVAGGGWVNKPDGTGIMRRPMEPAYGALAGIEPEYDEDGNVTGIGYDPTKGMIGVAGLMGGRKALKYADQRKFSSLLDQKPRFEIDDSGAKLIKNRPTYLNNQYDLDEILDHPALYKEYPELKNLQVKIDNNIFDKVSGTLASYNPKENVITLPESSLKNPSSLLHEIQHAIQGIEDFAKGGSISEFSGDISPQVARQVHQDFKNKLEQFVSEHGIKKIQSDSNLKAQFEKLQTQESQAFEIILNPDLFARERYKRLSGELESRAVQRRMDMPDDQRASVDPYADEAIATTARVNPKDFTSRFSTDISEFAKKDIQKANFGKNYVQFKNKPNEAIEHLLSVKNGEVAGAIHKPGVGDIDFVYGKTGADGYGLAHIAEKHPEIIRSIPEIIQKGSVINQARDRLFIQDSNLKAVIRLDWNGKDKKWLVTAFESEKNLAPQASMRLTDKRSPITSDSSGAMVDSIVPQNQGNTGATEFSTPKQVIDGQSAKFDPNDPTSPGYATIKGYNDLYKMGYSKKQLDKMGPGDVREVLEKNTPPFQHPTFESTGTGKAFKGTSEEYGVQFGNQPTRTADGKVRQLAPSDEEVDRAIAEGVFNEIDKPKVVRWFNRIFDPIQNAPESVQRIMGEWRTGNIVARSKANEVPQMFADIPDKEGWKMVRYIQDPTPKKAKELGLDVNQYKDEVQKYRQFYDSIRQEAIDAGLPVNYRDNYLNQVWKESPSEIDAKIKAGLGTRPGFTKQRSIPSYEAGLKIGLTPKFTHPAQLAAHYRFSLDKAIANKRLSDQLLDSGYLLPSNSAPPDWKAIDSPFFPKVTVDFGAGEAVQMDYKAPKEIAEAINNIFEVKEPGLLNLVARGARFMQEIKLSAGVPYSGLNSFAIGQSLKELTAGRVTSPLKALVYSHSKGATKNWLNNNKQYTDMMAREGISVYSEQDYSKLYKNVAESKSLSNLFGKARDEFHKAMSEPTFKRFMPMIQVQFFKDVYDGGIKQGMTPADAKKLAGDSTKNFYGIVDRFSRSSDVEDAISVVLLAPKFREAMLGFWSNNLKSINPVEKGGRLGIRLTTKNLKDQTLKANRNFTLLGLPMTYLAYSLANKAMTGRWMHENREGKELSVEIPRENGRSWYIPVLPTVSTIPRRVQEAGSYLAAGDIGGATERVGSMGSMAIGVGSSLLGNKTFYGGPIYQDDDPALEKIGKLAGYGFEQTAHPFIGAPVAVAQGRKTPVEGVMGMAELPIYPSSSTDTAHLRGSQRRKFNELNEIDPQMAMAYANQAKENRESKDVVSEQKKLLEASSPEKQKEQEGFWNRLTSLFSKQESKEVGDITELDITFKEQQGLIKEKIELGFPVSTNEYMVHYDLKKFEETPTDPIKATRQDKAKWDQAIKLYRDEEMEDGVKNTLISKLGIDGNDLAYYDIASDNTRDVRRIFTEQFMLGIGEDQDKIEELSLLRREVRGNRILTDSVIDDLVKYDRITKEEGKLLKNVIWDEATKSLAQKKKSGGKKISLGSPSVPKLRVVTPQQAQFAPIQMRGGLGGIPLASPQGRQSRRIQLKRMAPVNVNLASTYYQGGI